MSGRAAAEQIVSVLGMAVMCLAGIQSARGQPNAPIDAAKFVVTGRPRRDSNAPAFNSICRACPHFALPPAPRLKNML